MDKKKYLGVIDIGTSSIRFIIFNTHNEIVSDSQIEISQYYPEPGWVEEDAEEIWSVTQKVIKKALENKNIDPNEIIAIGITNQRESILIWDKYSNKPLSRLIVWQDRRTSKRCDELKKNGVEDLIRDSTGLTLDPYFSATKLEWLMQKVKEDNFKEENILAGTVDSWIIFKLTGNHLTDFSNASRTMLFNIDTLEWDEKLLELFNIKKSILPEVLPNYGKAIYGCTKKDSVFHAEIPICCVFGDQQSALFGQRCFEIGDVKSTYGTGAFLMVNIGKKKILSSNNLLTTIFFVSDKNERFYALEGSIYNVGSIFKWLKENLGIINDYSEIEEFASKSSYQKNLFFIPAFTGIGAPFWDSYATGLIIGLNRNTSKNDIIRAAEESVAFRTCDVLNSMKRDAVIKINRIKIDGGVSRETLFCQILADITGINITKFQLKEITALGAMYGAGIGAGIWESYLDIPQQKKVFNFEPQIDEALRSALYKKWSEAVKKSLKWNAKL